MMEQTWTIWLSEEVGEHQATFSNASQLYVLWSPTLDHAKVWWSV